MKSVLNFLNFSEKFEKRAENGCAHPKPHPKIPFAGQNVQFSTFWPANEIFGGGLGDVHLFLAFFSNCSEKFKKFITSLIPLP